MSADKQIICQYCKKEFSCIYFEREYRNLPYSTVSRYALSYDEYDYFPGQLASPNYFFIEFHMCPHCFRQSVFLDDGYGSFENITPGYLYPANTTYKLFNKDIGIPEAILQDYQEACLISKLSPKASATLSRRCLQGMIRDFHKVAKGTLSQEITAIKNKLDSEIFNSLNDLRLIGNVGAHTEKDINLIIDIEPDEALVLIALLELLFDQWYVYRHTSKLNYQRLSEIRSSQEAKRQEPKI